ncbi:thioredoxin domain-containing protein [Aureococcus anophagefferens]|uniref:Thioredoxin domain-containing protein n=2 Tax=Aureococcus anophagefferens TaxID=44056 RepID=A0ABR1FI77_AURAN
MSGGLICFGGVCIPINAIWPLVLFGLKYLSAEDWQAKIAATAGGRALVVDFTAPWCKPCQKIYPFFKRLAATFDEAATFVKVDVDDLEDVAEAAKVTMMPTFQVYRDGALAGALSGANENNLRHFVETHCLGAKKEN